jgi:glycerol-3-phosphate dehydrogenase
MLAKLAGSQGAEIMKETKVIGVTPSNGSFIVEVQYGRGGTEKFETETIINAAGLYSDEIAAMINPDNKYEILPLRGEYYRFNSSRRPGLGMSGLNVYQVQEPYFIDGVEYLGIGIHLTPTFDMAADGKRAIGKNVLVGPTSIVVKSKNDYETQRQGPEYFLERVINFFPELKLQDLELDYAGSRAKLKVGNDFVIKRDDRYKNAFHLVGIDSPGLTSSLAIAKYLCRMIEDTPAA